MSDGDPMPYLWIKDVALPVTGFVAGILVSRFTLTKKEKKEVKLGNYGNTERLIEEHDKAYQAYAGAIAAYVARPQPTVEDFVAIATMGDRYFDRLNQMSSAILGDNVDPQIRDDVLLPKVRSAVERTVPDHFNTLEAIAAKRNIQNPAELRRSDFSALYSVAEAYGPTRDW